MSLVTQKMSGMGWLASYRLGRAQGFVLDAIIGFNRLWNYGLQ